MTRKLSLLVYVLLFSVTIVAQSNIYQSKIDSLQKVKEQYTYKIQQIDSELKLLKQKVVIQSIKDPNNFNTTTTLYQDAKVREKAGPLGDYKVLPKGSVVTLLGFSDGYWKINYDQYVGYINDMYVLDNVETKRIKEEVAVNKGLAEIEQTNKATIESEKQKIELEKQRLKEEKQKKIEEEKEQKRFETAKASGSPIYFISAKVTFNAIDNPEASIQLKNISTNTIDAYTVGIYCYNRYGNAVNHYAYNTNRYGGLSQDTILPDDTDYDTWTLFGHENTAKIKVVIEKVHFTNGKTWYPKGNVISIEGVSDN